MRENLIIFLHPVTSYKIPLTSL